MESLQGKLLLATSSLLDPNFVQTVVLMVQHDGNGALGLVLNRPLETSVEQACEQLEMECAYKGPLFAGGPCEGLLMALHDDAEAGQLEVLPGVHFTTDKDQIEHLLRKESGDRRFFVGYSGWSAEQLENELESGSWLVGPAKREHVFGELEGLWKKLVRDLTLGKWIDTTHFPEGPSNN